LINKYLNDSQKTFILGKEIAYQYLEITDRSNLYSAAKVDSFDQLLNDLRASYFATSLMLKREIVLADLKQFFRMKKWDSNKLLELINKYNATPEIFFQRFTNLASKFLNLNSYFFLRFSTIEGSKEYHLNKELRLNTRENPGGYQSTEHYCRKWISIGVLKKLERSKKGKAMYDKSVVGAQVSEFYDSGDQYFNISISRRNKLTIGNFTSVTVGFLLNSDFRKKVKFWNDKSVPVKIVNNTCERCTIPDCKERVVPALVAERQKKYDKIKSSIKRLINEAQN